MRFRRSIFLVVCCLMLLVATACGGGQNNNNGSSNSNGNGSKSPANNEQNSMNDADIDEILAESPELDFDLGGRVIRWVSHYDESIKGDTPDGVKRVENLQYLQEKHNFTLEFVQIDLGEYQDKVIASILAGQPLGDLVRMMRGMMIPQLVRQDLFWPSEDLITKRSVFVEDAFKYSEYKGVSYGFQSGINASARGVIYNRTLMNELGLKPLQEYVDEDNWNWDTLLHVIKEANVDTDNDGKIDRWGLANAPFNFIMASNTGANFVIDGKSGLEDPRTVEVLNFMSTLATENLVRPSEGGDWTEPFQFFLQGNTLLYFGADYEMDTINNDMSDYDIGFLPTPKGPSATGYHGFVTTPSFMTIPKHVSDPENVMYIYEKIHDIVSVYDYPHQPAFETRFKTDYDIANAKYTVDSVRFVDTTDSVPGMPYGEIIEDINNGVPVSTVIETYKAAVESAVNEIWGE